MTAIILGIFSLKLSSGQGFLLSIKQHHLEMLIAPGVEVGASETLPHFILMRIYVVTIPQD